MVSDKPAETLPLSRRDGHGSYSPSPRGEAEGILTWRMRESDPRVPIPREQWKLVDVNAKFYAAWLLATALGAVGLGTGLAKLKGLGVKPFSVGFAAALSVGAVSFGLIKVLAPFLH